MIIMWMPTCLGNLKDKLLMLKSCFLCSFDLKQLYISEIKSYTINFIRPPFSTVVCQPFSFFLESLVDFFSSSNF